MKNLFESFVTALIIAVDSLILIVLTPIFIMVHAIEALNESYKYESFKDKITMAVGTQWTLVYSTFNKLIYLLIS